jgi:hypothetical protein
MAWIWGQRPSAEGGKKRGWENSGEQSKEELGIVDLSRDKRMKPDQNTVAVKGLFTILLAQLEAHATGPVHVGSDMAVQVDGQRGSEVFWTAGDSLK